MSTYNKVVLITGASSGIGKACAEMLAAKGFKVYGTSRKEGNNLSSSFSVVAMDVCQEHSVQEAIQKIIAKEGRIDILVNNAGVGSTGSIEDSSIADAKAVFETNFFGMMRTCKAVLPQMRKQGSGLIVNISSVAGIIGLGYRGIYCASKFAVEGFTEALRQEVKPFNIKVSMIEPGDVDTPIAQGRVMAHVPDDSPYKKQTDAAIRQMNEHNAHGVPPEVIGRKLLAIIEKSNPSVRYVEGPFMQKLAVPIKQMLPYTLFELLLPKSE